MATKKIEVIDPAIVERKTLMDNLVEDIKSLDAEREELKAIYEAKALALLEKYQDADLLRSTRREHLEEQLRGLFEQVPQAETKTQRKVELLSGDVVVKKASKKIDYDKAKLLQYAQARVSEYLSEQETLEGLIDSVQTQIDTFNDIAPDSYTEGKIKELVNKRLQLEVKLSSLNCEWVDFIEKKTTHSFKWAEFKANLAIQEGIEKDGIVDITTGEMLAIDGLSVVEEAEKLVIK